MPKYVVALDQGTTCLLYTSPLAQLLGHRIAHEEGFRILREQRLARGQAVLNAAALRLDDPGDGTQQRGLADVYKRQSLRCSERFRSLAGHTQHHNRVFESDLRKRRAWGKFQ